MSHFGLFCDMFIFRNLLINSILRGHLLMRHIPNKD